MLRHFADIFSRAAELAEQSPWLISKVEELEMKLTRARCVVVGMLGLLAGFALLPNRGFTGGGEDEAVQRTRKQTRMLDDLYKTAIVLITEHYVKGDEPAAAVAGKLLWKEMKAKGHHEVRLLDATGEPNEASNVATDDFEKSALKEIIAGQSSVERVVEKSGKRFLRTATAVPVVMTKCVACHPHYAKVPKGQAIGTLVYTLPVE